MASVHVDIKQCECRKRGPESIHACIKCTYLCAPEAEGHHATCAVANLLGEEARAGIVLMLERRLGQYSGAGVSSLYLTRRAVGGGGGNAFGAAGSVRWCAH